MLTKELLTQAIDVMSAAAFEIGKERHAPYTNTPPRLRLLIGEFRAALSAIEQQGAEPVAWNNPWYHPEAMDMAFCERHSVVLREGQLYRFRPVGDCETCAAMSKESRESYGEPLPVSLTRATPPSQVEKAGCVLVPVEPVRSQLDAMHDGPLGAGGELMSAETEQFLIDMYKAALAVSPKP